jgi:uncharacterized repeat protein (TIGR03803 family)
LRKCGILAGVTLACAGDITAWADWTPPESSVTPPAVVTLDAFAPVHANGAYPVAALVVGPDGALYGSTDQGGTNNHGTLFRVETNGTFTKLHDFNGTDGSGPLEALVVGPDGALFGSTPGERYPGDFGSLFRLETNGSFTKLHVFNGVDGATPEAALVVGPDGALYGSTYGGGTNGSGTLFRVETNGGFTKLHDFNGTNGESPSGLVVGPDGALYGSTYVGGTNGSGTLFRVETNGAFTELHDFNGVDGATPEAALVVGPDGALYGSTPGERYPGDYGTLFRLETNGRFTKLHVFNGLNGAYPWSALVVGPDGALYGSTLSGGTNTLYSYGALFRLETNGAFKKLHDFNGSDGESVQTPLVVGPDGALYGSTGSGGTNNDGTLFRVETNGTFTKLHDFNGLDGTPEATLVVGPDGALYGSAELGGATYTPPGYGTVFRFKTNGTFTKLYDFNATDGYQPSASLVMGPDGALYGSTSYGGTYNAGTLFRLEANGTFARLHDFDGTNGAEPVTALVSGPDGALYGSTYFGGTSNAGVLFRVETSGTFTKVHDFDGTNGAVPAAALVLGRDGALYGSTASGGTYNAGTLFRLEANGTFARLHDFDGLDGVIPEAALTVGPDGALYGSHQTGSTNGHASLFRLETNGTFTELHDFPQAGSSALVVGADGALYGSTLADDLNSKGTLFRLDTNGAFTKLYDFHGADGADAVEPSALVLGPDGALYGSTLFGGTNGSGTIFRLETNGAFTKLYDFDGTNGSGPSAPLVLGPDGALYGSTIYRGTVFRVKPDGTFAKLYDFNGTNGSGPPPALVVGPDGNLYSSAPRGGPRQVGRQGGILFKIVLNRAPVGQCHDVIVSAGANCAADASVDNGSFDPDASDTITLRQEPPGPYPLGVTPVMLTVMDNHGASNSCTATVTVMDATPPTISDVAVSQSVLSPPNHKMVEVTVNYTATDNCGGVTNVLVVTSNESPNGPVNGRAPDWVIEDDHRVQLRAERSGTGSGRVYAITVISTDSAGNSSTGSATVAVPKNPGK